MRALRHQADQQDSEQPALDVDGSAAPETYVLGDPWTGNDALVAVLGAGMAAVGVLALSRTSLGRGWYQPIVEILGARHTPLLGLAETGAGGLVILAGVARLRGVAALLGLTVVVVGALAAVENAEVHQELAIEHWWAWALAAWGLIVSAVALVPPPQDRVERVVETH